MKLNIHLHPVPRLRMCGVLDYMLDCQGVSVCYGAQTESLFFHSMWANLGAVLEGIMSAIQECRQ